MRVRLALLAGCAMLVLVASAGAIQQPYVAIVGCSNSALIGQAYFAYSSRDAAWNAAQGTYSLKTWSTVTAWTTPGPAKITNPSFDQQLAQRGQPSAVWFPVCIPSRDFPKRATLAQREAQAWQWFLGFHSLLRQRTQAPLWLTDTLGEQHQCPNDDTAELYVVTRAVSEGYGQRSSPDIPPASHPDGECHFDPILSTNVGQAAAQFIDG